MPIRPELRVFYGPAWRIARQPILARAGNACEHCSAPNYTEVDRCNGGWWREIRFPGGLQHPLIRWRNERGESVPKPGRGVRVRRVRIVLTVAHLNHTAGDDREENLRALCQWCHLNLDKEQHRETRAIRKDAARPLLAQAR